MWKMLGEPAMASVYRSMKPEIVSLNKLYQNGIAVALCENRCRWNRDAITRLWLQTLSGPTRFPYARFWIASGLPTIRWAGHSGCHAGAQWDVSIA